MALEISAEERFFTLLNQLKHMPPCSSRQEAHDMLLLLWMRIRCETCIHRACRLRHIRDTASGTSHIDIFVNGC